MDPRMVKAGIATAIALTLLLPTFNALNGSYVNNVTPPSWLKPEKPPNITPPTDWIPPDDFELPDDYEGEFEGQPPCPPPVLRMLDDREQTFTMGTNPEWSRTVVYTVPNATLALVGYVNATDWNAQTLSVALASPSGAVEWRESVQGNVPLQPNADVSWFYNSTEEDPSKAPAAGDWQVRLDADFAIGGTVTTRFAVVLACGGLLS